MQLSKPIVIILVAALTILAIIVAVPAMLSTDSTYDSYLKEARYYSDNNLCKKAMSAYENALAEKDSLSLRIEMAENYKKGITNGEFSHIYNFTDFLLDMLDAYYKDARAYDTVAEYLYDLGEIDDCVSVLYQAEDLGMITATTVALREKIRYQCSTGYASYEEVIMTPEESYLVKDEKYRLYTSSLTSVDGANYEFATPMLNGAALVKTSDYTFLISSKGIRQVYFPHNLTDATGVGDSLIAVQIDGKYTYYNLQGEPVFGEYDYAGRFANGIAPVMENERWYLVGTDGQRISEQAFEDIKLSQTKDCSESGRLFAKSNGKYYLYDCSLNQISTQAFDDADVFYSEDELVAVKQGELWGYINLNGETVIAPQYEEAKSFSNGLAGVRNGEYWSFINESSETVITGEYADVSYFNSNGCCFVQDRNYWTYIQRYYNR